MDDAERKREFLEAMSRGSTFVTVLTTEGEMGRFGVTVSSMTSVSADGVAPTILACVHHKSPAAAAILTHRGFCANILHESQQAISDLFSGRHKTAHGQRFDSVQWRKSADGHPLLAGATANFECVLRTSLLWETHHVMIGHVTAVHLSDDPRALLYGQRSYRRAIEIEEERPS
jgi:flavin reductase (DIM6/NTAB) family NADH-FMN oxidoreductase RutF